MCVGVSLHVGRSIIFFIKKQLLALPHTARYLRSAASRCTCHLSSLHVRTTPKLPSGDPGAGLPDACSVRRAREASYLAVWEATHVLMLLLQQGVGGGGVSGVAACTQQTISC